MRRQVCPPQVSTGFWSSRTDRGCSQILWFPWQPLTKGTTPPLDFPQSLKPKRIKGLPQKDLHRREHQSPGGGGGAVLTLNSVGRQQSGGVVGTRQPAGQKHKDQEHLGKRHQREVLLLQTHLPVKMSCLICRKYWYL